MAKISRFSDELLTEAVEKYAKVFPGQIHATELAEWAKQNIEGLEDVRDYNFTRSLTRKDNVTGKTSSVIRPCTELINQVNQSRKKDIAVARNPLITSANLDDFFGFAIPDQRKMILDARKQIDMFSKENVDLERQNKALKEENQKLRIVQDKYTKKLDHLLKNQKALEKKVDQVIAKINNKLSVQELENIGIYEDEVILEKNVKSLSDEIGDIFSISGAIKDFKEAEVNAHSGGISSDKDIAKTKETEMKAEEDKAFLDSIMGGLHFEGMED